MPHEKEVESIGQCSFQSAFFLSTSDGTPWAITVNEPPEDDAAAVKCVVSPADTTLRLTRMFRKTPRTGPRWKPNLHFHPDLVVPPGGTTPQEADAALPDTPAEGAAKDAGSSETTAGKDQETTTPKPKPGLILTFEAVAREGIAVALSPQPQYTGGETYEIFYGDRGNTQTLIERRSTLPASGSRNANKISVALPGRHCSEKEWKAYWIALYQRKVYVGLGENPPQQCLGVLDDISKQDQSATTASSWFVGMGNSSMRREGEPSFLNRYRNIRLAALPSWLKESLAAIDPTKRFIINVNEEEMDEETKALFKEYKEECEKARVRAEKFGLPYKEPPSFLPWSQIRRLQANPTSGFATGMDLQDPAEKAKQEARRKRFGLEPMETSGATSEANALPIEQAWDNHKLVKHQRVDPPVKLWKIAPTSTTEGGISVDQSQEFASQLVESVLVPEKIHLFSIDWAAFKQIRTKDLSAYFSVYSPTYIEWLGDLSCNIFFQDKFTAARALENLSQEIPSPPPATVASKADDLPDLGAMGWRFGKTLLRKVADDRYGRRGTTARVLLRLATSHDVLREKPATKSKIPPGFNKNRVLGPGSEFSRKRRDKGKRNRGDEENGGPTIGSEPSLLSGSLKASRSGFSVEEMEAERARKRAKTNEILTGEETADETSKTRD